MVDLQLSHPVADPGGAQDAPPPLFFGKYFKKFPELSKIYKKNVKTPGTLFFSDPGPVAATPIQVDAGLHVNSLISWPQFNLQVGWSFFELYILRLNIHLNVENCGRDTESKTSPRHNFLKQLRKTTEINVIVSF